MILLTPKTPDLIKMEIKTHIPQVDIIHFLQCRGYEVKGYCLVLPPEEGFLIDEPRTEIYTFTATKEGEGQSPNNEFLKVFEREIKEVLKEFMEV